jgi:UDP-glucose 4-epimerase
MQLIVVTGAFGFLGRHTSLAASKRGDRVIGIGHGNWTQEEANLWGVSAWHETDVTLHALDAHAESANVIVHCAGSGSAGFALDNPAQAFERTVGTTLEVLEFIRTRSPQSVLVFPSTGAVYGHPISIPVAEETPLNPISLYAVHKKIAEDLVRSYAVHFALKAAIVRVFSVYGVGLRKQLLWDACKNALRGGGNPFFGTGDETRDWVAAEDVADLLLIAGARATTDAPVVNCATGIETSIRTVLAELFTALGTCQEPQFSGDPESGAPTRYAGNSARALNWGWNPQRTWRAGVAEYARWFLDSETRSRRWGL